MSESSSGAGRRYHRHAGSEDITTVYRACWKALDAAGINYTCHWGQENELSPARLADYYGDRVERWRKARARVLPKTMGAVFTNTLVKKVGLG